LTVRTRPVGTAPVHRVLDAFPVSTVRGYWRVSRGRTSAIADTAVAADASERDNAGVRTVLQTIALAMAGALLGLVVNALHPAGVSILRRWVAVNEGTAECAVASVEPAHIDVAAAMRLLAAHEAIFGDVRAAADYAAGHVVDAVHLPCSAEAPEWLATVAKSETVVLYGGDDADPAPVAQSLAASGYGDVRVLSGGFPAWRDNGGSAASGPCEICN
jgi:rhodanese-related sulfurtransferase